MVVHPEMFVVKELLSLCVSNRVSMPGWENVIYGTIVLSLRLLRRQKFTSARFFRYQIQEQ